MAEAIEKTTPAPSVTVGEKPNFEIKTLDDLKRVLIIAKGGDPDAIQAVSRFVPWEKLAAQSYFPDKLTAVAISQLNGYSAVLHMKCFSTVADVLSVGFMSLKGFKTGQFVQMTQQTANLSSLESQPEEVKRGFLSNFFNRGAKE